MIQQERKGDVLVLSMHHGADNRVDTELLADLSQALDDALASDAKAVVLTGNGTVFIAGGNVQKIVDERAPYVPKLHRATDALNRRLFTLPKPVVAAVEGNAVSDGCSIAAACDYRVMADRGAVIGIQALPFQVPFPVSNFEVVRHLISSGRLRELLYSGKLYEPQAALTMGLVDQLAPPSGVVEAAVERATFFGAFPPPSFRVTKRQLREETLERIDRFSRELGTEITEIWSRPEILDALTAFWQQFLKSQPQAGR